MTHLKEKKVLYSPTTGGPMKVATPCRKDIIVLGPYSFIDIDHNDTFDHDDGDVDVDEPDGDL